MAILLREYLDLRYDKNLIKEAREKKAPILVKAVLQRADAINQNKRIYPRNILEREVENYRKAVAEGRATGELDHPDSSVVSLERVSHMLRDIWWEGSDVLGTIEVLNTPKGKIAQELMEAGVKCGISSRGVGETIRTNEGYDMVDESFMLIAFDLVSEPSTQNAWLGLREGREIEVSADKIRQMVPKVDRINRIVNEILRWRNG
jgi:hypothetical protein